MKRAAALLVLGIWTVSLLTSAADEQAPAVKPASKPAAKSAAKSATGGADTEKPASDAADKSDPKSSVWMRKKLEYTQNILAGITAGDFDLVSQNANAMKGLSKIEAFVRGRTPGYRGQLQVFQEANDEILRQAQKENAEGAALAFTQLTISCINCHKQLREHDRK